MSGRIWGKSLRRKTWMWLGAGVLGLASVPAITAATTRLGAHSATGHGQTHTATPGGLASAPQGTARRAAHHVPRASAHHSTHRALAATRHGTAGRSHVTRSPVTGSRVARSHVAGSHIAGHATAHAMPAHRALSHAPAHPSGRALNHGSSAVTIHAPARVPTRAVVPGR